MEKVDYTTFRSVRDFSQDVAKVMGKTQQVFLPEDPREQHRGILVTGNGLATKPFNGNQIHLDLRKGEVQTNTTVWSLRGYTPRQLLEELRNRISPKIAEPVFAATGVRFDNSVANHLADLLSWSNLTLEQAKNSIKTGETTSVLLYPHHFDISFAWFVSKDLQYTFGFSTGDETIPEPYFYVTAYPEPDDFTKRQLSEPAYWQKEDFSGAVLKFNDIVEQPEPKQAVRNFIQSAATPYRLWYTVS